MIDSAFAPWVVLVVYGGLILLASLAGGWIPLFVRLTHTRLQVAISFVAGLMLGVGVLHLLPHSCQELPSIDHAAAWLLGGFLIMFFVQRFFHFHHHDVPDETRTSAFNHPPHESTDAHHECHGHSLAEQSARRLSWSGAALGLMFHTVLDGIALGASVEAAARGPATPWLMGFGTFLVIFLHKPFDALAISALLSRSGGSRSLHHWVNALFSLGIPVGVTTFYLGANWFANPSQYFLGSALAFAAGTFVCIAASDLLPELQFHEHDRLKLSLALVAGLSVSALIGGFETTGHEHLKTTPTPVQKKATLNAWPKDLEFCKSPMPSFLQPNLLNG
jgi:zinc and cadmium transporter